MMTASKRVMIRHIYLTDGKKILRQSLKLHYDGEKETSLEEVTTDAAFGQWTFEMWQYIYTNTGYKVTTSEEIKQI